MASGQVYWDNTGELMVPPPEQRLFLDHIEHGMSYEVLAAAALVEDESALRD